MAELGRAIRCQDVHCRDQEDRVSEGGTEEADANPNHRKAGERGIMFFAAAALIAAILVTIAVQFVHHGPVGARHDRLKAFREAARQTDEEGLGGLQNYTFLVPKTVIPFRKDFTVGELTDVLQENIAAKPESLVDRYGFSNFVLFLGRSFAVSPDSPFRSVSFNSDLKPASLAIWFIDPSTLDDPQQLGNTTCAYLGFADVIVCNTAVVRQALNDIAKISQSQSLALNYCDGECPDSFRMNLLGNLDDLRSLLQQNFIFWLIGHEIGHAVRHRDWALISSQPLHFLGRYDPREVEADHFVGEAVDRLPALKASFAPLLLEYADQRFLALYRQRSGPLDMVIPAENQPKTVLKLDADPEAGLLFRALGMITTILARDPQALGQIYLRPIGTSLGFVNSVKSPAYVTFLNSKVEAEGLQGSSGSTIKWYVMLLMIVSGAGCLLVLKLGREKS